MPQQPKTEEQLQLEAKIASCCGLLKTLRLQLVSIRRRNKASREQARRKAKCTSLAEKQQAEFHALQRTLNPSFGATITISKTADLEKLDRNKIS